jgi:tetratricopeptide (TPR) repeat protein
MLTPKKKITKKEIKQDGLISAYAQATSFYYENKKYISYAFTALLIIVVGSFIYVNNRRANNEKAAAEFAKVFPIYDAAATEARQYKVAIDGQPERGIMGLKAIVDNYGGTESGEIARFYLANAYFQLGQYDDALKNFDSFSGSNPLLEASAFAGMGGCYEVKGEYAKAASYFEKAANKVSNTINTPDYLNSAARCYGQSGEKEKALTLYKKIKKEYPTSSFARDADRYIAQFSA